MDITIGYLSGILVLIILAIAVIAGLKKSSDNKAVDKFINDLADKILEIVIETIDDINPNDYVDFYKFKNQLISNVYNAAWDYVSYTAQEAVEVDQITKTVFKLINRDTVSKFVDTLLENNGIYDKIQYKYVGKNIEKMYEDKEDEKLQKEYSNQELYFENVNNEDLVPAKKSVLSAEELEKINPPKDEEEEYVNINDDSVEIIVDDKEIVSVLSDNGQVSYYEIDKDGTKTKVSKEYAQEHMKDKGTL